MSLDDVSEIAKTAYDEAVGLSSDPYLADVANGKPTVGLFDPAVEVSSAVEDLALETDSFVPVLNLPGA